MELKSKVVTFRDGTSLTVTEANWQVELDMSSAQDAATKTPMEKPSQQIFHLLIYPKLAGCSTGDIPTEADAASMPVTELNQWYEAAKEMNPHWFKDMEDPKSVEELERRLKKKGKRPIKSSSA